MSTRLFVGAGWSSAAASSGEAAGSEVAVGPRASSRLSRLSAIASHDSFRRMIRQLPSQLFRPQLLLRGAALLRGAVTHDFLAKLVCRLNQRAKADTVRRCVGTKPRLGDPLLKQGELLLGICQL